MFMRLATLASLLAASTALQLRPTCAARAAVARPALRRARAPLAEESVASDASTSRDDLILFDTLSKDYQTVVLAALEQRNKMRILSGMPRYESIQAMVDAYMEFEGAEKGLSAEEAEDEVVRFLQRQALLDEGGLDGDPQELVTFGLLAALIGGIAYATLFPSATPPA